MEFLNIPLVDVDIKEVNQADTFFKISRNTPDEALLQSISASGILEPPVLLRQEKSIRILSGHNRLEALRKSGEDRFSARICDDPVDPGEFIRFATLKNYRNEIGPIGRIRLLRILRDYFKLDIDQVSDLGYRAFGVPPEYAGEDAAEGFLNNMPEGLRDYCDARGVNFRVMGKLLRLPAGLIQVLEQWISGCSMRVNIFRSVVGICYDLWKRDGLWDSIAGIDLSGIEEKRKIEEHIFTSLQAIRYPEYTSMRKSAEGVREYFNARNIGLDYPEYFEGDSITLRVAVKRGSDPELLLRLFNDADVEKIREVLALL